MDLAANPGDRRGEDVFEFVDPARGRDVLVGGHPADGRFVHLDLFGDLAQR